MGGGKFMMRLFKGGFDLEDFEGDVFGEDGSGGLRGVLVGF